MAEPIVPPAGPTELVGDWLVERFEWTKPFSRVPAEAYLHELADADPRSSADLQALAGMGAWCPPPHSAFRDLPFVTAVQWRRALVETAALNGRTMVQDLEQARDDLMEQHHGHPVHLDEIAIRLRTIQALTRHTVAFQDGAAVRDAWRKCPSDSAAWERFADWANAALRDIHVRVTVQDGPAGIHTCTVYTVAVLQLVNDLSDSETFRRCANETCGRPFVRQRGRAQYADKGTRHATGVLYCSRLCARAQAERMRRRNKRNERNGT